MKHSTVNTLRIATPDGIVFELPLAGPAVRGAALFIDYMIVVVILNIVQSLLLPLVAVLPDIGTGVRIFVAFGIQLLYATTLEWCWGGRTIGKRIFQLRVVDDRGLRLRPGQIILRNLMRSIDMLPAFYLVGGICCYLNRRCQRLGDLASGTVVVRTVAPLQPPTDLLAANRYNSLRNHPHLEARLRQLSSPQEVSLVIDALRRRETLEPDARIEVYARLADHFRGKIEFPEECVVGLTDEQYLRNVVDTICRQRGKR
jgi:uncharacterized RDD family membrane protein YckC